MAANPGLRDGSPLGYGRGRPPRSDGPRRAFTLVELTVPRTRPSHSHSSRRSGFTLVELMVTMGIMVVLAAMIAVTMGNVAETARIDHTRAEIARLHTLLMDRYESYRWRRLPIQIPPASSPAAAANYRCDAIRELMRLELPDRWTDITDNPAGDGTVTVPRTAASLSYQAAYNAASPTDPTYQGADCLYLIVTMGLEENDVLENFSQSDIGPDPNNPKCFVSWTRGAIRFNSCAGPPASFRRCNRRTTPIATRPIRPACTAIRRKHSLCIR